MINAKRVSEEYNTGEPRLWDMSGLARAGEEEKEEETNVIL